MWIELPAMTMSRLRHRLDEGAGRSGLGLHLIETLGNGDYRLRADRVEIGRSADFADIPAPGFLSPAVKAAVLSLCPVW